MTKEKAQSLTKYVAEMAAKLSTGVPSKHAAHPETYKAFLEREIRHTKKKLDEDSLVSVDSKK